MIIVWIIDAAASSAEMHVLLSCCWQCAMASLAMSGKSGYVWQSLHGKQWQQTFAIILPGFAVSGKVLATIGDVYGKPEACICSVYT